MFIIIFDSMKKLLLTLFIASGITLTANAQTATNFSCNDCAGNFHDLFSELESGKVIVIDWVMPCGACTGPSQTTYNTVSSFQASHPNRVFFYLADDYANTNCASLNSWANSVNIPQNAFSLRFSNAAIDMTHYGSTGMPKVVVLGGANHTVFLNANGFVSTASLQNAINSALAATGISETNSIVSELRIGPNPASQEATLRFTLAEKTGLTVELYNLGGQKLEEVFSGEKSAGEYALQVPCGNLETGLYLVKVEAKGTARFINLQVTQ